MSRKKELISYLLICVFFGGALGGVINYKLSEWQYWALFLPITLIFIILLNWFSDEIKKNNRGDK